jgi:hypothetical protein
VCELVSEWTMEGISDDVSSLHPRVPSLYFGKRHFEAGKTNLLSHFGHGGTTCAYVKE